MPFPQIGAPPWTKHRPRETLEGVLVAIDGFEAPAHLDLIAVESGEIVALLRERTGVGS
jgi:hypothetical protein